MQTLVPWQGSPEWSFQIFPHHVVQRGMRRMDVFFSADDRQELPRSVISIGFETRARFPFDE